MNDVPFWRHKDLMEMSDAEWESLCDGCGRCCLNKLEEEDTGKVHYTDIGCRLLDGTTCRCKDYQNRGEEVNDCVRLTPENASELKWLPPSCALPAAEPMGAISTGGIRSSQGDAESVHAAGIQCAAGCAHLEGDWRTGDRGRTVSWRPPAGSGAAQETPGINQAVPLICHGTVVKQNSQQHPGSSAR